MSMLKNIKIGVSGVRGVIGETLTPALASNFAMSFGEYTGRGTVIVGRDTRASGFMLEQAVVAGLCSAGCRVILAGIVPTPTLQIAVRLLNASGGVAVTASHNPVEWNALKFIGPDAYFLSQNGMAALLDVYNQPGGEFCGEPMLQPVALRKNLFEYHQKRITDQIDIDAIKSARLKVAVDCCNGVGALYSERFLRELGCAEVFPVFTRLDAGFERPPEPVAKNLSALSRCVLENHCDIGFAQDPDGDRIGIIDENGLAVGEQYSVLPAAERVLERTPGPVVANLQTTSALSELAARFNCRIIHSAVGEANVAEFLMRDHGVFGAEGGSGGVMWPAVHPCRDSFSAMALTLESIALKKKKISSIYSSYKKVFTHTEKLECPACAAEDALRRLARKYVSMNPLTVDGVRFETDDGFILLRQSNTEPVVRIYAESACSAEKAAETAALYRKQLENLIQ